MVSSFSDSAQNKRRKGDLGLVAFLLSFNLRDYPLNARIFPLRCPNQRFGAFQD